MTREELRTWLDRKPPALGKCTRDECDTCTELSWRAFFVNESEPQRGAPFDEQLPPLVWSAPPDLRDWYEFAVREFRP